MKKDYLRKVFPHILEFSFSLDKTSVILDKPWVSTGAEQEREKYIFKKNHELLISRQGNVEIGRWEYLEEAKSFLIKREHGTYLYKQGFLDKVVFILKVDGREEYLTLANENLLPDMEVKRYLEQLRYKKHNIQKVSLADGSLLEVERQYNTQFPAVGDRVTIEGRDVPDGKFHLNDQQLLVIDGSRIQQLVHLKLYQYNNRNLTIEQQDEEDITEGDLVKINGKSAKDGLYLISRQKYISVQQGQVVSIGFRKHVRKKVFFLAIIFLLVLLIIYFFFYLI